jgi:hypothetical protein
MIELYDPLTDEPTGEYALFEAPIKFYDDESNSFKLDMLPGFKDVRIPMETVPGGSNIEIPVCVAAQIGATLTNDVAGTSFPAYSAAQHKFCIPSLAIPKVAVLPGGKTISVAPDCYEVTLNTATTQKNGVLKITNNAQIDKNLCQ